MFSPAGQLLETETAASGHQPSKRMRARKRRIRIIWRTTGRRSVLLVAPENRVGLGVQRARPIPRVAIAGVADDIPPFGDRNSNRTHPFVDRPSNRPNARRIGRTSAEVCGLGLPRLPYEDMRPAVASQEGSDERALTVHSHHDSCTPRASDLRARAVIPEQTDAPVAHCRCRWIIGIT